MTDWGEHSAQGADSPNTGPLQRLRGVTNPFLQNTTEAAEKGGQGGPCQGQSVPGPTWQLTIFHNSNAREPYPSTASAH